MTKERQVHSTEEALKLALEALELCNGAETVDGVVIYTDKEIAAIKEALAQPAVAEQHKQSTPCGEPVAWGNLANWCLDSDRVLITDKDEAAKYHRDVYDLTPLYTTSPQRKHWTNEQKKVLFNDWVASGLKSERIPHEESFRVFCAGIDWVEKFSDIAHSIAERKPEQEPVMHTAIFHCPNCDYPHRQVTHITGVAQPPWSPQRTWVGLTRDEKIECWSAGNGIEIVSAVEAKLKAKNFAEEKNT